MAGEKVPVEWQVNINNINITQHIDPLIIVKPNK